MITLALGLLLTSITRFPGGSYAELTKAIADGTSGSAVICVYQPTPIPAFEFDAANLEDMALSMKRHAKVRMAGGSRPIFYPPALSAHLFSGFLAGIKPGGFTWTAIPQDALSDGALSYETPKDSAIKGATLENLKWSKPLSVHWVYGDLPLTISAKNQSEADFLSFVAKALGGRVVTSKDGIAIDLDPSEFRLRAKLRMEEYQAAHKSETLDEGSRADLLLLQSVLSAASENDLKKAFAHPGAEAKFVAGPGYSTVVRNRILGTLKREYGSSEDPVQYAQGARQAQEIRADRRSGDPADILNRINTRAPAFFVLKSDFRCFVEVSLIGQNGGSGGSMRF